MGDTDLRDGCRAKGKGKDIEGLGTTYSHNDKAQGIHGSSACAVSGDGAAPGAGSGSVLDALRFRRRLQRLRLQLRSRRRRSEPPGVAC